MLPSILKVMLFARHRRTEQPASTDRLLSRGVATYVLALLLIAAFSITSDLMTDSILRREEATARVVNLTGRQRMFAQRIVRLSIERALHTPFRPDGLTEAKLGQAIAAFEQGDEAIRRMRRSTGGNPLNEPAVQAVYISSPWHLDGHISTFLGCAHRLQGKSGDAVGVQDSDLRAVEAAVNGPLIDGLNAVVDAVQQTSEQSVQHLRQVLKRLTGALLLILFLEAVLLYRPLFKGLRRSTQELVRVGRTDPLTGCLNRRAFLQESEPIIRRAHQRGQPLCVMMLDLDRFKAVNDRYGHPAGDSVIHGFVATALEHIRGNDLLCRMGGEEFAILLPGSRLLNAEGAADRLRAAVADKVIHLAPAELGLQLQITVSIGVAMLRSDDDTIFPLLSRADRALYCAKENGRNRVERESEADLTDTLSAPDAQRSRV